MAAQPAVQDPAPILVTGPPELGSSVAGDFTSQGAYLGADVALDRLGEHLLDTHLVLAAYTFTSFRSSAGTRADRVTVRRSCSGVSGGTVAWSEGGVIAAELFVGDGPDVLPGGVAVLPAAAGGGSTMNTREVLDRSPTVVRRSLDGKKMHTKFQ